MTPEQFIRKWTVANLSERSAAQQHFADICLLLGEPTPAEADPTGETFTFEKGGTTATGGHGWADTGSGAFAWEYKGPGKDRNAAYLQLKTYADMLENPPLLITSDTKRIEIHTNFTNTVKVMHALEIADLTDSAKRELLRAAFAVNPEKLRPGVTRQQVTKEAAESFSELAHHLQEKGYEPKRVAHFLNRIIFCMFAEDVGLLPNRIFTKLASASVAHPETFEANAKQLFQWDGNWWGRSL